MSLTKQRVDKASYDFTDNRRFVIWDEAIPGFGLRVYPSGKKSFVLSYRSKGRKHLLTLGIYGVITVEQARREARIKLGLVADGGDPISEKRRLSKLGLVSELCELYLIRHAKVHKKSWKEDERRIRSYLIPSLGSFQVVGLSVSDVTQLHLKIGERSIYEANRTIEILRGAIEKGKNWGFLESNAQNPAKSVRFFKEKKRDRWLSKDELPRVAAAIAEEPNIYIRSAIWLYLLTGVRKSELLKAKWSDVNWGLCELRLENTKAGNDHYVPLSPAAIAVLAKVPQLEQNPFIVPGRKIGSRLIGIARPWMRIRKRAGVEDVRLHDLRRTVGSMLAQGGASLHLIGRVLNHKSLETTKVYARFGQDSVTNALANHGDAMMQIVGRDPANAEFPKISQDAL